MEFEASLDHLSQMMSYIFSGLNIKDLQKFYNMQLACEEALVNIIAYAYPEKKGIILIERQQKNGFFEVVLRDLGIPFNPLLAETDPKIDVPMEERKIGGLGLFLIKKMADDIKYERKDNQNVLRLSFNIKY